MVEGLNKEGRIELDKALEADPAKPPPPPASRGTSELMAVLGGVGGPSGFRAQRRRD